MQQWTQQRKLFSWGCCALGSLAFLSPCLAGRRGELTVQLPDAHPVLIGQPIVQWVTHWALVVGLHDGACSCHVAQTDGMAKLVNGHCKEVHAVGIWEHSGAVSQGMDHQPQPDCRDGTSLCTRARSCGVGCNEYAILGMQEHGPWTDGFCAVTWGLLGPYQSPVGCTGALQAPVSWSSPSYMCQSQWGQQTFLHSQYLRP